MTGELCVSYFNDSLAPATILCVNGSKGAASLALFMLDGKLIMWQVFKECYGTRIRESKFYSNGFPYQTKNVFIPLQTLSGVMSNLLPSLTCLRFSVDCG